MDKLDAVILDNWEPTSSGVKIRNGFSSWATGLTGSVETLMQYASGGTRKLFAAANSAFYDVSASGAIGAAAHSGHSNNRWQYVNFGTAGGNFIIAVNGADTPLKYDGSSWATTSITGVTSTNLVHLNVFKERLFFVEKNSLSFWYLPVSSIAGAASEFDLSAYLPAGGELQAMATWTVDGGNGVDDLAVFISTEGEVAVYQGTDPSDSTKWSLTGVFRIGRPIGRRCFAKVGGDLIILTDDGFVPLSKSLISGRAAPKAAISDKISKATSDAVSTYRSNFGWQPILYPNGNKIIVNVPTAEDSTSQQFVYNTISGAWCRFTGINAFCWEIFNNKLYFGGSTKVYQADTGNSDDGAAIRTELKPAFSQFGQPGRQKLFTGVRPIFRTTGSLSVAMNLDVDYADNVPTSVTTSTGIDGATWDVDPWDTSAWGPSYVISKGWQSVAGIGMAATAHMRINTATISAELQTIDYMFQPGGFL